MNVDGSILIWDTWESRNLRPDNDGNVDVGPAKANLLKMHIALWKWKKKNEMCDEYKQLIDY